MEDVYVSALGWFEENNQLKSKYNIRFATSQDGINWNRNGTVCIDFKSPKETNIARTWVLPNKNGFEGWYCSDWGKDIVLVTQIQKMEFIGNVMTNVRAWNYQNLDLTIKRNVIQL